VRKDELEAIGKAIEIISDQSVAGSYGKHVGLAQTTSLLQVRSARSRVAARTRAASFLRKRAQALSSSQLQSLAGQFEANPFDKVVQMIKDLIAKLKEEAAAEAEHKAWCDEQLHANKIKREKKTAKVNKLTATVDGLTEDIATMTQKIATLSSEQAALGKAMSEATELRSKEKAKNLSTIKDAEAANAAVKQALVILKDFYSNQAFLQTGKQVPEMKAYTGMQGNNGGVIGMLEVIQTDFARLTTETKANEAEAARTYNTFMAESKTAAKAKHDHEYKLSLKKDEAEFQHGQTKKSLKGTQEELDKALSYYQYLKPNCGTVHVSFEERTARRKEEIEALKEAYKILSQKSA